MAGEQLFSKFVIKGGGKTFTEQSTILIFRQKPIRLIVVNAAVIETYTVKKCTNRSRCAHGIYSLTMILKKNAKYRLFDFIQVKAKAGNTGIGIGLCHRKHLIHYGSESPCRIQNNSLNNFAKVICVFRVTHHEIVDGAVLQTELLRTNKHLGSNILFLSLSGSHAYGTNVEGSDIDIRGVAGSPEILGFNRFEQAIDNRTDTVIYAVNKFVGLLAQGNPNIIELLGNDPELYVDMTPEGQMLLDNRELFLTRRIAYSYGGFANDQLRRLQMGLLRNGASPEAFKNKFEKRSLERSITGWGKDDIFEISISEDTDEEGKHPLLISGSLNDYPVTSLKSLLKSLTTTIDQYEQPQHPKAQKDAAHINKHAMHIVRLYYTAFDILEKGEIITRRDKEREELLAIRNGKYLREDGSYAPEFFELVDALEKRFQDDARKTALPAKPDFGKIEELLVEINKEYLRRVM